MKRLLFRPLRLVIARLAPRVLPSELLCLRSLRHIYAQYHYLHGIRSFLERHTFYL